MTMTTEYTKHDLETITQGLINQAKQGSCKTCEWCQQTPSELAQGDGAYTHVCELSSQADGDNALYFLKGRLDDEPYPFRHRLGELADGSLAGNPTYQCLAYKPRCAPDHLPDPHTYAYTWPAGRHRDFMEAFQAAVDVQDAITNDRLGKLVDRLNRTQESLPASLRSWPRKMWHDEIDGGIVTFTDEEAKPSAAADKGMTREELYGREPADLPFEATKCAQCGKSPAEGGAEFGIIDDDGHPRSFCDALCLGAWNVAHGLLPWGEVPALDAEGLRGQALTILMNTLEFADTDQNLTLCHRIIEMLTPIFRAMHLAEAKGEGGTA